MQSEQALENPQSPSPAGPADDALALAPIPAAPKSSEQGDQAEERPRLEALLAKDTWWIRAADVWDQLSDEPVFRWKYPVLQDALDQTDQARTVLSEFLEHDDPVIAANAAIGLARWANASPTDQLKRAIRDRDLDLRIRRAAAEGLAALDDPSPISVLRELLDDYSDDDDQKPSFCTPAVHAELIRGLSWHVQPDQDPRFSDALKSRHADVKLEALRAWITHPSSPWPEDSAWLRGDQDWRVRAAALTAMAARPGDRICEYLTAAVEDSDLNVRVAAIAGLSKLRSDQSRAVLDNLLKHPTDRIRAEAVSALAAMDAKQTVLDAAADKSWQVRAAVARALSSWPDRDSAAVAQNLLEDRSCKVQEETVAAVARWPSLKASGPILLSAMAGDAYATRRLASEELKEKWAPASEFPHDAKLQHRAQVLQDLENRFRREIGFLAKKPPTLAEIAATARQTKSLPPDRLESVLKLLKKISDRSSSESVRRETLSELARTGPQLVELLERLIRDRKLRIPEPVYSQVLPGVDPVFEVLDRLSSPDVLIRRRAIDDLAKLSTERNLDWLAVDRLSALSLTETDPPVWSGIFRAVAADRGQASAAIAHAALTHSSPEVRRLGCQHLGYLARGEDVRFLTPALEDSSVVVVRAATEALGLIQDPDAVEPLQRLLRTAHESLRVDVSVALAGLDVPAGALELERLSFSTDESVRHRVAIAMGQIGDPDFTGQLIRLLDDRQTIGRAAMQSLVGVVGRDVTELSDGRQPSFDRRRELWKEWSRRESANPAGVPEKKPN